MCGAAGSSARPSWCVAARGRWRRSRWAAGLSTRATSRARSAARSGPARARIAGATAGERSSLESRCGPAASSRGRAPGSRRTDEAGRSDDGRGGQVARVQDGRSGAWHSRRMRAALFLCLLACGHARGGGSFEGVERAIARGDAPKTTSVLVMHGADVAYEHFFADATAETLHDTRSATKSLTALTVGIAVERKLLPGVTAPAFGYLGDLAPFAHDEPLK